MNLDVIAPFRELPEDVVSIPLSVPDGDDRIYIRGLRAEAVIGAYAHEREWRQTLEIDLELDAAHSRSCFSDKLDDAIDYAEVAATVRRLAKQNRSHLLEAFAQQVADTLLGRFALKAVAVSVSKPGILDQTDGVGVSIRRRRADVL